MSVETGTMESVEMQKQYVCFIKSRAGSRFKPYTAPGDPSMIIVKTKREFLDHEISRWFKASESEKLESAAVLKVSFEQFVADVDTRGVNARLASMLGWNYAEASRIVESEGCVLLLTAHPRFESKPYSLCSVRDDDDYAMEFIETLLSIRGGQIAFEEYDPEKHVVGYQYEP
jgi:hypothetical protein